MSSVTETTRAGWRPDPSGRYEWRYWDNGWTNRVANSASPKPASRRPEPAASRVPPDTAGTAPPPSEAELAVMRAVAAGRGRAAGPAALPPAAPPAAAHRRAPASRRAPTRGFVAAVVRWFRTLADEEESYHSPKAGVALDPHPKADSILASGPRNYGQAGLVALAAFGFGVGAYLPWLTGTIGIAPFERTGFDLGRAWGFTWLAAAIVLSALLAVRLRPLRYASMALAIAAAALAVRELLEVHELVTGLNRSSGTRAEIGIGIWIILAAAAGVLVTSFRTDPRE